MVTDNKTRSKKIFSFYRFKEIENKKKLKLILEKYTSKFDIKGTILIADEGINGTVSGRSNELKKLLSYVRKVIKIRKISLKINLAQIHPFNKFKIRIKKEIVSIGIPNLSVNNELSKYIKPTEWSEFIQKNNVKLIDTRNIYEIAIGKFKNAINPETKTFREFPTKFDELKIKRNENIAIYCTGGIRCEKAAAYLNQKGYKNVYQLEGGILNYLEKTKNNDKQIKWNGECFVFDKRVAVNNTLNLGRYKQCYGCRRPITLKDSKSKNYKHGVYCPYCYRERSEIQIKRSTDRQEQINKKMISR